MTPNADLRRSADSDASHQRKRPMKSDAQMQDGGAVASKDGFGTLPACKGTNYEGKLWCDLNSDIERAEFLEEGRGSETGIIAKGIQKQVAEAFRKAASGRQ